MIRAIFFRNATPMWVVEKNSLSILEVNRAATEFYGYERELFLDKTLPDLQPQTDNIPEFGAQEITANNLDQIRILYIEDKWGNVHSIRLCCFSVDHQGHDAYLIKANHIESDLGKEAAQNFTDRRKYQQKFQRQKHFIEKVLNSLPGLFFVLDKEGNFVRTNDAFTNELGHSRKEVKHMNLLDLYHEDEHRRITEAVQRTCREGRVTNIARMKKKDDTYYWYHLVFSHLKQNGSSYILGTAINITKRINAEQQLEYQTELLSNLFNNAPVGIAMVDSASEILDVNDRFEKMFGYTSDKIIGSNIDELITLDKYSYKQEEIFRGQRKGKDSFQYESVRIKSDGTEVPVMIGLVPIVVSDNTTISYIIYVDITERKAYLDKVRKSLKEKRVLLHEIHHRVKNNLAIMSSLLQLQKINSEDEHLQNILSDNEMRLQTMALIHEQLYQAESLSEINFDKYIRELVDSITKKHEPQNRITFNIDCENITLNINQAVPCAMILNELISNSFEHAFEESENGEIHISLTSIKNNITLSIQDNGCGLPPGFDLENSQSLGYTIVDTLIKQLKADSSIENKKGTKFSLTFVKADIKGSSSSIVN